MQETLLLHAVLTLDASQKYANLYVNDATSKWLALAFYWTAYQFSGIDLLNSSPGSQYICDRFVSSIVAHMRCY